jgi:hypothetical protein
MPDVRLIIEYHAQYKRLLGAIGFGDAAQVPEGHQVNFRICDEETARQLADMLPKELEPTVWVGRDKADP